MAELRLGLCGFTIGAARYYKQFTTLEVQQTFYDPPTNETLRRWRGDAPAGFQFLMKAWQVVTHRGTSRTYRRLRSPFSDAQREEAGAFRLNATTLAAYDRSMECATILDARVVLFQCPPSFKPTEENADAMRAFFGTVRRPPGVAFAWEPRGKWPAELVRELCTACDLIHAVDPFVSMSVTPALTYWRLHGIRSHYASYTDEQLSELLGWLPLDRPGYVLFNNIPRVADAARFRTRATSNEVNLL